MPFSTSHISPGKFFFYKILSSCMFYIDVVITALCALSQVLAVVHHSALCKRGDQEGLSKAKTVQSPVPRPPAEN